MGYMFREIIIILNSHYLSSYLYSFKIMSVHYIEFQIFVICRHTFVAQV
jgi:hypothetical protein